MPSPKSHSEPADPGSTSGSRLLVALSALSIGLVALLVRFSIFREIFTSRGVVFAETDPFYHVRRIGLMIGDFPSLFLFDSYVNFPEGARILWPPGFDLALAGLGILFGGSGDAQRVTVVCAVAIPFLALGTVWIGALLARRPAGLYGALFAAALIAILPVYVEYSLVGRVDHHVLEPFLFGQVLWTFLRSAGAPTPGGRTAWAVASGCVIALSFWLVMTAILIPLILVGAVVLVCVLQALSLAPRSGVARCGVVTFGAGSVALVPLVILNLGDGHLRFSLITLSWLHEIVLVACGLVICYSDWLLRPGRFRGRLLGSLAFSGIALVALTVLMSTSPQRWAPVSEALRAGFGALSGRIPVVSHVSESRSPLGIPLLDLALLFTPFLFWTPVLWVLLAVAEARKRFACTDALLLLAVFPLTFAAFLFQYRFGLFLAVPLAVLGGWGFERALAALRGNAPRWPAVGTALVTVLAIVSTAERLTPKELSVLRLIPEPTITAYHWLREHSPPTRGFDRPEAKPGYGVLTEWARGHALTYFAERPNIANAFSLAPWHVRGVRRASRILLDTDAPRAVRLIDALDVLYLVLEARRGEILSLGNAEQGRRNHYVNGSIDAEGDESLEVLQAYFETLHARLLLFDGQSVPGLNRVLPEIQGIRLVYESPEAGEFPVFVKEQTEPLVPRLVKVFERVPGAEFRGRCSPGAAANATARIRTNLGRTFEYTARSRCDEAGWFRLRVPYGRAAEGGTGATGTYRVQSGASFGEAQVGEHDVLEGRILEVALHPDGSGG